jgi:molybdopterin converting factor small subunit
MKIKVRFEGFLSTYAGTDSIELELPDGARYDDLLKELATRYGSKFPERCWDSGKKEFKKPISAIASSGDIETRDTLLSDNEEIHFLMPISGG